MPSASEVSQPRPASVGIKSVRNQMVASDIMNTAAIRSAYVLDSASTII